MQNTTEDISNAASGHKANIANPSKPDKIRSERKSREMLTEPDSWTIIKEQSNAARAS